MDEVKEWFKKAKRDLEAAKSIFQQGFYDISASLLQQALEKALKALYTKKFKQLVKTHNLIFLTKKLNLPKKFLTVSRKVNPFYIESRYPPLFVAERYKKSKISNLIKEVEAVIKWIEKNL